MPRPAMSGADPWTGSNMDGKCRSGLRLALGAMPIEPTVAASVTTTPLADVLA